MSATPEQPIHAMLTELADDTPVDRDELVALLQAVTRT
ncbi:hypothetical protein FHU38_003407 [Saccharomonospora amisosensis]|uniref:Uncharacterized protein n=1 Tax=Saccharomonospora amisosensis TaxID=1128677 RepID=A0A7X5USU9_9PSEU|nr:hypothetical protein [Saccharomonospora amisosensis]